MADQLLNAMVVNIGVINNALLPVWKVPAGYGGITIVAMQETFLTAGTAQLYLVDGGTAGTSTNGGTLATGGGTAHSAKTPVVGSVASSAYLGEGSYLTIKEGNVGSTVTVTEVAITFKWGK